jgi:uncharacterized membrane protein
MTLRFTLNCSINQNFAFILHSHEVHIMTNRTRFLAHAAMLAALYASLCWLQELLLPNSASFAIQFRVAEALCVLALFTPAAIPGMTIGCLLFNLTFSGALPLDFLMGTAATLLAAGGMYLLRNVKLLGYPLFAMTLPALFNAILVGWELAIYIGGGFWINALYVAIGELAVLFILGTTLYYAIRSRGLDRRLFG